MVIVETPIFTKRVTRALNDEQYRRLQTILVAAPERALGAIKAKTTVMAGQTDLYFTPADIEADAASIPGAKHSRRSLPGNSVPLGSHGRCRPQPDGFAVH